MNSQRFLTFQKFSDHQEALLLKQDLEKGNIEVVIEDTSVAIDITFSGNTHGNEFLLKIKETEFVKANDILEAQAAKIVDQYAPDHYLFEFSDEELFDVIGKADEWSKEDFLLSQKILRTRGHEIDSEKIEEIKLGRLNDLRKPEQGKKAWIIFGYIFAFLGGLLGVIIGWSHWKATKIDPTGKRFYVYNESTRKSGKTIFLIGILSFILWLIIKVIID